MAETINMPKLGFDMQEGTLVRWLKNEGENINKGDVLAEIETDKATVEVESSASGVVRRLLVDQGAVVPIGTAIAVIGAKDEKIEIWSKDQVGADKPIPAATTTGSKSTAATSLQPAQKTVPMTTTPSVAVVASNSSSTAGPIKASPLARKIAR